MKYLVSVYMTDLSYGGPEEGGWHYEVGEIIRTVKTFKNQDIAYGYCRRLNDKLDTTLNKNRRSKSSVLSEGEYTACVHKNFAPQSYPETTPHYE